MGKLSCQDWRLVPALHLHQEKSVEKSAND